MAGALAERRPARREDALPAGPAAAPVRRPQRRPRRAARSRTMTVFILFAVAVALLAVGRVALSFAVVQKNRQTDAIVHQQRAVRASNVALTEEMAKLTANDRVRARALNVYGLVPVDHVTFIRLPSAPRSEKSSP